jgi:hypothetical protein
MSKEPGQRFADGDAFAAAFRDPSSVGAGAATAYVPMPPADERTQVLTGVPPQPAAAPEPAPTPVAGRPVDDDERRSVWPIVLLVLALVAVIVLIVVLVARANDGDDEPSASDSTSSTPTSSAPTSETTASESTSSAPAEVNLDEGDYLGRPVDEVVAELRDLGLKVNTKAVDNPGDEDADTVASVSPTSGLVEGDKVTVEYYREAKQTSEPPSSDTSSPSPSDTPTASSPTASGSAAPNSQSPSASNSAAPASPSASGGA